MFDGLVMAGVLILVFALLGQLGGHLIPGKPSSFFDFVILVAVVIEDIVRRQFVHQFHSSVDFTCVVVYFLSSIWTFIIWMVNLLPGLFRCYWFSRFFIFQLWWHSSWLMYIFIIGLAHYQAFWSIGRQMWALLFALKLLFCFWFRWVNIGVLFVHLWIVIEVLLFYDSGLHFGHVLEIVFVIWFFFWQQMHWRGWVALLWHGRIDYFCWWAFENLYHATDFQHLARILLLSRTFASLG